MRAPRRAISSAGERCLHTAEVVGSIPTSPTIPAPVPTVTASAAIRTAAARVHDNADWLLILACLPLFATNALFNLPLAAMGGIAIWRFARAPRAVLAVPGVRLVLAAGACLWLPMLAALPDAAPAGDSLRSALGYLRFPLAGVYVALVVARPGRLEKLALGAFVVVGAWCVDAMIQFFAGRNLLGFPHDHLQLNGIFYPRYRLGLVTAVLLPIFLEGLRLASAWRAWTALALLPLLGAILLAANRNAWMMTALGLVAFGLYLHLAAVRVPWRRLAVVGGLAAAFLATVTVLNEPLQARLERTGGLAGADLAEADRISGYRLSLWRTAWAMFVANPVNGIGPRRFREVYAEYAPADDFWLQDGRRGQTHPHQQLLEVAAETGTVGLAGYVLLWLGLLAAARAARRGGRPAALPWLIAAGVAMFPLNAHMAFYSSYWSALAWWLLAIAAGAAGQASSVANNQGASRRRRAS